LHAEIFGFVINLRIASYFEAGMMLTSNHGHAAFTGALFCMPAMALPVPALRHAPTNEQ
jgi:nitric oxide reductase subunit B